MPELAQDKMQKLEALFGVLPDKVLKTLTQAVSAGQAAGDTSLPYDDLLDLLKKSLGDDEPDALEHMLLQGLLPFVAEDEPVFGQPLKKNEFDEIWAMLKTELAPEKFEAARADFEATQDGIEKGEIKEPLDEEEEFDPEANDLPKVEVHPLEKIANALSTSLSEVLQEKLSGGAKARKKIFGSGEMAQAAEIVAGLLAATQYMRRHLKTLPESFEIRHNDDVKLWRRRYEDLSRASSDAGLYFMCMAVSRMPRPSQIFRVVSEAAGGRSESFVSETELSAVGGFIAGKAEELLSLIEKFDPMAGKQEVDTINKAISKVNNISIDLEAAFGEESRGPWSVSIMKMCAQLGGMMEQNFKSATKAFDKAFPTTKKQLLPRVFSHIPKMNGMPQEDALTAAKGYARLIHGLHNISSYLGFGTARHAVATDLEKKSTEYVEQLLDMMKDDEREDMEQILAYGQAMSEFVDALCGVQAGEQIRRRIRSQAPKPAENSKGGASDDGSETEDRIDLSA